jgi:glycosyltransferase involved in cell wall biosynthesis/SAM-dependent methyltransferase
MRFGALRRVTPISREFGFDRGVPIDRYYIEKFLSRHRLAIAGRVLEIGDDSYTKRFGGGRVARSDILHVESGNPRATIVGGLENADHIESDSFDCVVLTQTLHLIYETAAAIRTVHRILKPGGSVLATVPGVSQIANDRWGRQWFWSFSSQSVARLFSEVFPPELVRVEAHGNVLSSVAFLHGLATDELTIAELEERDPLYELIVAVRAVKRGHDVGARAIEVADVTVLSTESRLRASIDLPTQGARADRGLLEIAGWVFGEDVPAVAVEATASGPVLRRVPLLGRPDVATAFPGVPGAERAGFRAFVPARVAAASEITVQAVLRDQRRVPFARIALRSERTEAFENTFRPLVSVVIPCHNQARFMTEAIESVLAQTYSNYEIVVIDDGSEDNTGEIGARYPMVRCVRQENCGLAAARNRGVQESRGEYLLFLDADDRLLPGALEAGLECFAANPDCGFVFGRHVRIGHGGEFLSEGPPFPGGPDPYEELLRRNWIAMHATVIYRRGVFASFQFNPSLRACEDYDLYLRVARELRIQPHDGIVAEYRRHGGNMSAQNVRMLVSSRSVFQSQRASARAIPRYRRAWREGIRFISRYYGEALSGTVRADLREGRWKAALSGVIALARYYPRGLTSLFVSSTPTAGADEPRRRREEEVPVP